MKSYKKKRGKPVNYFQDRTWNFLSLFDFKIMMVQLHTHLYIHIVFMQYFLKQ